MPWMKKYGRTWLMRADWKASLTTCPQFIFYYQDCLILDGRTQVTGLDKTSFF